MGSLMSRKWRHNHVALLYAIVALPWRCCISTLPANSSRSAWEYGTSVFSKTRFSSHLSFLRTCLDEKVVPYGFKIQHHSTQLSKGLQKRADKVLTSCSRQLMRTTLMEFSDRWKAANTRFTSGKVDLTTGTPEARWFTWTPKMWAWNRKSESDDVKMSRCNA